VNEDAALGHRPTLLADADDPALSVFLRLTDVEVRRISEPRDGIYIAEGLKVITRAADAGHRPLVALTTSRWIAGLAAALPADVPIHVGDESLVQSITGYRVHRGALVAFARPADPGLTRLLSGTRRLAVLEDLKEHTNVGAVVRSAAAFGIEGIVVSPDCADPLYRRAVKVSMGTVFTTHWTRATRWPHDLERIRDAGFRLAALTPDDDAESLPTFVEAMSEQPIAWLLGTEGPGLSPAARDLATDRVRIPMQAGVDSLNVGAAAAVAFYAGALA
jgi:tRNA G18 (ribose-2'-O)-methylase SpoU